MAIKYIPYDPTVVRGQAVLNNFTRTRRMLRYHDQERLETRLVRGMPLYETETIEPRDPNGDGNLIIQGECLSACAYLHDKGVKVDLVYIDPPFASQANYAKKIYLRCNPKVAEAIAKAEEDLAKKDDDFKNFELKMYGDIWQKEDYLNWMYENLMAIKSVMSDTASIYVHLDWHIGHYVKILMDEIFGEDNFRGEIIWKRTSAHNDSIAYANIHDVIFFYQWNEAVFNTVYTPYTKEYIKNYYSKTDERGNFKDSDLTAIGKQGGGYIYEWKGVTKEWICPKTKMEDLDKQGRIYYTSKGTPRLKQYLSEMPGIPAQDLWTDISPVNSQANEDVDYDTQKPEALLERIISASSNEGMIVADFFGGSGVTAKTAHRLGRKFITGDVNINSIQTMRDGLVERGASFTHIRVKDGVRLFRNGVQTMENIERLIPGLRHEPSISTFWQGAMFDTQHGMMPVYVPNLADTTKRVLDEYIIDEIIHALPDLPDEVKKVIVYYVDMVDPQLINEIIRKEGHARRENGNPLKEIELRDLKPVLDNVVMEDDATWQLTEVTNTIPHQWRVTLNTFTSDRAERYIKELNKKRDEQNLKSTKKEQRPRIELSDNGLELIEWLSLDCTTADPAAPWHSDAELKIEAKTSHATINGHKTQTFWDATISVDKDDSPTTHRPLRLKIRNIFGDETVYVL